jgi:beta-lactamase superfamily II metal-dependent hydrolase
MTFKLTMFPASEGDCLLLSWGEQGLLRHALTDLGHKGDYKALRPIFAELGEIELFTITHIDADHIEGAVPMFVEDAPPFRPRQSWFNAYHQLGLANERLRAEERETLGAAQAEKITVGLVALKWPWNACFASGVVSTDSEEAAKPITLEGGLMLRILSPTDSKLSKLIPKWDAELAKANLRTTDPDEVETALAEGREALGGESLDVDALAKRPFVMDRAEANGSAIAFLAEYRGKRVLMGADAHPDVLEASLRALGASEDVPFNIDCFKLPHHGSKGNLSPKLLSIIDCTRFAISTNGNRFSHPDPESIARILKNDPKRTKELIFNFRQERTEIWATPKLMKKYNYTCIFPEQGSTGVEIQF